MARRCWIPVSGSGTGNWSDTAHWSDTPQGSGGFSVPATGDTVEFTQYSFTGTNQVVTLNATTCSCASMNWTGALYTPTLACNTRTLSIYGNLTLITAMNYTYTDSTTHNMRIYGTCLLTTAGKQLNNLYIYAGSIDITLGSDLTVQRILNPPSSQAGGWVFDTAGYAMTVYGLCLNVAATSAYSVYFRDSIVTVYSTTLCTSTYLYFYCGTSTIKMVGGTFSLNGYTHAVSYYDIEVISGVCSIGNTLNTYYINSLLVKNDATCKLTACDRSITTLTVEPGATLTLNNDTGTTFIGEMTAIGTTAKPITLNGSSTTTSLIVHSATSKKVYHCSIRNWAVDNNLWVSMDGTDGGYNGANWSWQTSVAPTVTTTTPVANLTSTTVDVAGVVLASGGEPVTARGWCYATTSNPNLTNSVKTTTGTIGAMSATISTGLVANTHYYIRAYCTTDNSTAYGDNVEFTTINTGVSPTVVTDVLGLANVDGILVTGSVTSQGTTQTTIRGYVWGVNPNPEYPGDTHFNESIVGEGAITPYTIAGLNKLTTYHVRAFVKNTDSAYTYGVDRTFVTIDTPLVPAITDLIESRINQIEEVVVTVVSSSHLNRYWIGGSGNWNDVNHWAYSNGGYGGASVPGTTNPVYFDQHSFTAEGQTVTLVGTTNCAGLDWTGALYSPTFNVNNRTINIYISPSCNFTLIENMTYSYTDSTSHKIQMQAINNSGSITVTTAGNRLNNLIPYGAYRGPIYLGSDISIQRKFQTFTYQVFYSNNYNIDIQGEFCPDGTAGLSLDLGTSIITLLDGSIFLTGSTFVTITGYCTIIVKGICTGFFYVGQYSSMSFGEIQVEGTFNVTCGNSGGYGELYLNSILVRDGGIWNLVSAGRYYYIPTLTLEPGSTFKFHKNVSATIGTCLDNINIRGTAEKPIYLISSTQGTYAYICRRHDNSHYVDGVVDVYHCIIEDNHAYTHSGAAVWNAYDSTNVNDNSGWYFPSSTTPSVTTASPATNITTTTADVAGEVTSDGGSLILQRGFVYGTSPNPTTSGDHLIALSGTVGVMSTTISNYLNPGTLYYVRTFASNENGTSYGNDVEFTTSSNSVTISPPIMQVKKAAMLVPTITVVTETVTISPPIMQVKKAAMLVPTITVVTETVTISPPIMQVKKAAMLVPTIIVMNHWITPKFDWLINDHYNYWDANRVDNNSNYLKDYAEINGYSTITLSAYTSMVRTDLAKYALFNLLEHNINAIKDVVGEPDNWITLQENWGIVKFYIDYTHANRLESNQYLLKAKIDADYV